MAFIRTKKIKGKEYAYIAENIWRKRGKKVKQKTKKYLGKIYRFNKINTNDFLQYYSISNLEEYLNITNKENLLKDLIKLELIDYGFQKEKNLWKNENIVVDLKNNKVSNEKNKPAALAFNEGFLSDFTIKRILNFKAEVEEDGYDLAKLFVEAGIAVPKEIFVGFFRKIFK